MSWKLWAWQRFQQLIGALAVIIPTVLFVCFLVWDSPVLDRVLPQRNQDVSLGNLDNPRLDHIHIATAIGSCHLRASPVTWSKPWQAVLKVSPQELVATGTTNGSNSPAIDPADSASTQDEYALTPFERAAIYHSDRLSYERRAFAADADNRQRRLRSNQTRILFVSAAAAFLVGLRALVASKDADLPFRSLTQGSLLPISALVLLVPVIGTALSGLVAFDDDATVAIRDTRAVSQLEQLHGRIAEDVISDPYLCPVVEAIRLAKAGHAELVNRPKMDACLFDRFQRTNAWEQRHEQVLNDANQTLAHAGDLPKPAEPSGASHASASSGGDKCQEAFTQAQASHASAELTTPQTQDQALPDSNRRKPL